MHVRAVSLSKNILVMCLRLGNNGSIGECFFFLSACLLVGDSSAAVTESMLGSLQLWAQTAVSVSLLGILHQISQFSALKTRKN